MAEQIEDDEEIQQGSYIFKVYDCPKNQSESEAVMILMQQECQESLWAGDDGSLDRASEVEGESLLISQGAFD